MLRKYIRTGFIPPFDGQDYGAHGVRGSAFRGWARCADWVDPKLIVTTPSRKWHDIDREPPRGTVVNAAQWLHAAAQSCDGIDQWLKTIFGRDPMLLRQIHGPAGPIYEAVNGTQRAHAARIWGPPHVLTRVQIDRLLTPIGPGPSGISHRYGRGYNNAAFCRRTLSVITGSSVGSPRNGC